MKVLQIACGFSYSTVYNNLFSEMKKKNIEFQVYVPQHRDKESIKYSDFSFSIYSNKIIKSYDKLLYYTKIRRMLKDVELNFQLSEISLIHAHSLFSDGAVAYEIYRKYGIPYVVAIRNTDVNKYFKYALHLRKYGLQIMKNAKKIIFISPAYQKFVIDKYVPIKYKSEILKNVIVIPNGIDQFWLDQTLYEKKIDKYKPKLIFVGRIDKNKNLKSLIKAVYLLRKKGIETSLDVVGDGPLRKSLERSCINDKNIVFHGPIYDKDKIKKLYSNSDILVVPSFTETFGLVYLEAMSCGLPVIYTKKQGFDGFFPDGKVGYAINSYNFKEIPQSVELIMQNYARISGSCYGATSEFNWENISKKYINVYYSVGYKGI